MKPSLLLYILVLAALGAKAQTPSTAPVVQPLPTDNGFAPQQPGSGAPGMVMPLPLPQQAPPPPPPRSKPVHHGPTKAQREEAALAAAALRKRIETRREALDLLAQGRPERAENVLQQALRETPDSLDERLLLATAEQLAGRPQACEAEVARASSSHARLLAAPPAFLCESAKAKPACAALSRGLLHDAVGDRDGALRSYDEAVRAAPKLWLGYALRGILRARRGDCADATSDLQYAATLQPAYAAASESYLSLCPNQTAPEPPAPAPTLDGP